MHRFQAALWRWEGDAPWHFLTLPEDVTDDLRATCPRVRGFGSVPVRVTVGELTWSTSVFLDRARDAYLLPVKKAVRTALDLAAGDCVDVRLEVLRDAHTAAADRPAQRPRSS